MQYYLSPQAVLKHLETPSVYQIAKDELYELDGASFAFLKASAGAGCEAKESAFIDYCRGEGIISADKTALRRPPLVPSPVPSLRHLDLQITNACNLRCRHCYLGEGQLRELSEAQIGRVLREFEGMQGLRVAITGGEPLLHSRFAAINEMLPDFALRKVLFTNGLLLDDGTLKRLNVQEVQVSIDGLERAHDAVRGEGTFACALDAVKRSLDAGLPVSVATMAHPGSVADFGRLEKLFRRMGIKDWTVDVPCEAGRLKENPDLRLTPAEGGKCLGYGYGGGVHGTSQEFGCGLHLMAVLADGRAAKCAFYGDERHAAGSTDEGLRTCWERVKPVRLAALACDCEYIEVCRGGCRYRAEALAGRGGKDLYRCALYGLL